MTKWCFAPMGDSEPSVGWLLTETFECVGFGTRMRAGGWRWTVGPGYKPYTTETRELGVERSGYGMYAMHTALPETRRAFWVSGLAYDALLVVGSPDVGFHAAAWIRNTDMRVDIGNEHWTVHATKAFRRPPALQPGEVLAGLADYTSRELELLECSQPQSDLWWCMAQSSVSFRLGTRRSRSGHKRSVSFFELVRGSGVTTAVVRCSCGHSSFGQAPTQHKSLVSVDALATSVVGRLACWTRSETGIRLTVVQP